MRNIGIIGTGIMGRGIARNFLQKGYRVMVWNRSREKYADLLGLGAVAAATAKQAAEASDMVFEVTANDESSRGVWLGADGILAGSNNKKTLIASATLSAGWTDELAGECARLGVTFFDMPLTGGRTGAETGRLTLLAGGDAERLDSLRADLAAISQKVLYFGKAGSGMRYKLILNMMQGVYLAVFGEALALARSAGLDLPQVGSALSERFGDPVAAGWKELQTPSGQVSFSVQWIAKDLQYCKRLATEIQSPFLDEALGQFRKVMQKKMGEQDWTSVIHS